MNALVTQRAFPSEPLARAVVWLSLLAETVERKPTKERVTLYAEMLAEDASVGVLDTNCLHAVAKLFRWWPSYKELSEALEDERYTRARVSRDLLEDGSLNGLKVEAAALVRIWRSRMPGSIGRSVCRRQLESHYPEAIARLRSLGEIEPEEKMTAAQIEKSRRAVAEILRHFQTARREQMRQEVSDLPDVTVDDATIVRAGGYRVRRAHPSDADGRIVSPLSAVAETNDAV